MKNFLKQRLLQLIPTIIGISLFSFIIVRLVPGDPVLLLLGERGADPKVYAAMQKTLGLDRPILEQYLFYMKNVFSGDFGISIVTKQTVVNEFFSRFPATLELGICAMIFAILIGIPAGVYAALKRNSFMDYLLMGTSLVGYSMPIFWWGLILIIVFSVNMGITPVSGRMDVFFEVPSITGFMLLDTLNPEVIEFDGLAPFTSALKHLILPTIAMGTIPLAVISRMTRSSVLEVLKAPYIQTAKAKGQSYQKIVWKHAVRNALIPIVTVIGLLFGSIITGAILTETIFSWPGIGRWLVASIHARDYPVIQGGILFIALMVIFINMCVDIIYSIVNPKIAGSK
ncbi:ABC transporter permease subunit [Halobacteriovorax vibrionivorans]|uniref:ABC transporter permease subunit n=1 Tax=Halobacteriovorax vibrionivorans TaxID=2152716 RepID=A0ABY0IIT9_9BACT|nr:MULTISPECIES: ABC transporter permease subunit [Halobacteriovorax]RZF21247.1 ABC transporter permease subunit [Halobacteriovorax vibrionivorans]TGD47995.1 ABC transporter permease subunit [Halobacteriovorax sp. Y22]